jgi:hypothetical protein
MQIASGKLVHLAKMEVQGLTKQETISEEEHFFPSRAPGKGQRLDVT